MNPDRFQTLIEMLAVRAIETGSRPAFTFKETSVTFRQLWEGVNHFGSYLLKKGMQPGERVLTALPNGPEFFYAFYGIQRAGGIAVPVFPLAGPERIIAIAQLCDAHKVVVPSMLPGDQLAQLREIARAADLDVLITAERAGTSQDSDFPEIRPEQVAFLQYTSGSTGNPKGVIITQANLLTNVRQMIAGMEITPEDVFVSWLPVYHDMGLILKTMVPFYLAAELFLLPTNLRDVKPWLEAIEEHKGTFTAAPDFAYRLVLRKTEPFEYDLSCLRVALNAAEPVRETTITSFHQHFGLKNVMVAGYGLAEATVGVSMWPPGTPNRIDAKGAPSVGVPFPGVEAAIVCGDQFQSPGQLGEITIRSTANSLGYFNNQAENEKLFWKDGYLLSGDLGYLDADGYLYIISRKKNILKRSGVTISPWEIEEVVDRRGEVRYSAAIGIDRGSVEGEQIVLFAEIRNGEQMPDQARHELAVGIVADIHDYMGFRPARVYLLKPKGIPLTDNGKVQHVRLRELFINGSLRQRGVILYPEV
ncbi:MAG: AMP-binding protein [Anaerolineales bacterium]|nr:AMP-binding protein [Anaerolineales bacterium]